MDVLRAQINKIKRYNIYSLFNVKNILNKILDKLSNVIVCRVDVTDILRYYELFQDFNIYLTKDNFKNYFNLSIEDVWKNLHNINTFKFLTKCYINDDEGYHYKTYTNPTNEIDIFTILSESNIKHYSWSAEVIGPEVHRYNEEGIFFTGKHRYSVHLEFTENGELFEEESYISFYCDVEAVEQD